jgi:hypothetical protein
MVMSSKASQSMALLQAPSFSVGFTIWDRQWNFSVMTAFLECAFFIFASTLERGMYRFKSKTRITLDTRTVKQVKAAFSKSVSETSMELRRDRPI